MVSIGSRTDGLPESSEAIEGPRVQRQVCCIRSGMHGNQYAAPTASGQLKTQAGWFEEQCVYGKLVKS